MVIKELFYSLNGGQSLGARVALRRKDSSEALLKKIITDK